mmetsp:Transcript_3887/g.5276  ORF Transcript_3887/g.5276 Transcript_3887/m.5276 type:complete len:176 (+) Transcript_3887:79-606(+)
MPKQRPTLSRITTTPDKASGLFDVRSSFNSNLASWNRISQFKKVETKVGKTKMSRSHSNLHEDADHNDDTLRLTTSVRIKRPAGKRERNDQQNLNNHLTDFKHGESLGAEEKEAEASRSDDSTKSPTSTKKISSKVEQQPQRRREPRIVIEGNGSDHNGSGKGETARSDRETKQI